MSKKKDKQQVINNIQELNLEIDYDKLAEAMVRANNKIEAEANQSKNITSGMFSMLIFVILRLVAFAGWLIAFLILLDSIDICLAMSWIGWGIIGNIFQIVYKAVIIIMMILYSLLLWRAAKEFETEKDRNYVISVFSGIVSFAALIVALIALFKGVG